LRRPDAVAMSSVDSKTLDTILALQLAVGWAGEKADNPRRLGWWDTDLTDALAGGDLFGRLLPKTAAWAGLELARKAALRADKAARDQLAHPDQVWTLFHFGFELDEALQDRLEHHKRHGHEPADVFGPQWAATATWDQGAFEAFLQGLGKVVVSDSPAGRKVSRIEREPVAAARALAAALLPLGRKYPLPYTEVEARA
jgi:hypothetical protein